VNRAAAIVVHIPGLDDLSAAAEKTIYISSCFVQKIETSEKLTFCLASHLDWIARLSKTLGVDEIYVEFVLIPIFAGV